MEKKLQKRRMILINYSLALSATIFCVLLFSLKAVWFVPLFLLFSPWKDENKNIFSVLGGINYDGNIYSFLPLFQWSLNDAYGFFGFSFYQVARKNARLVAVISLYQKARFACSGFGINFYQAGREVSVFFGLSLCQNAKKFALLFLGISLYQKSGYQSLVSFGCSFVQTSKEEVSTWFGVSFFQKSNYSTMYLGLVLFQVGNIVETLFCLVLLQKTKTSSFSASGLTLFQISEVYAEIGWGFSLLQKAKTVGTEFGFVGSQVADKIAVGKSLAIFRKGESYRGVEKFNEVMVSPNFDEHARYYW